VVIGENSELITVSDPLTRSLIYNLDSCEEANENLPSKLQATSFIQEPVLISYNTSPNFPAVLFCSSVINRSSTLSI
jgi:hypothetical protein